MTDCLFCTIINGDISVNKIYEDEDVLAFYDIKPRAPYHFLVIPKTHIKTLNNTNDEKLLGKLILIASNITQELGFADKGYRVVMNCNKQGGQTVYHIHLHCLGGRILTWPPG
ncbi:MAG: histidine triad nucleotide-binding protein [Candidatus Vesicomyosocius endoextente]|uniref:Histidine triad nucleotide-binding protein n=1 Tax=Candidatus Vesicomyosocius endoextente TaxID=2738853 RepID=A0A853GDG5_9GAMM|nr:histidine triad nucleotide-binding protein [Candidatus Vesicomyosocius endoextente]